MSDENAELAAEKLRWEIEKLKAETAELKLSRWKGVTEFCKVLGAAVIGICGLLIGVTKAEFAKTKVQSAQHQYELDAAAIVSLSEVNKDVSNQLGAKQIAFGELTKKLETSANLPSAALQLGEIAKEARKQSGLLQFEVRQNSWMPFGAPLNGYAIHVGSVGRSNAEDCIVFRNDEELKVPMHDRKQAAISAASIVAQRAKLRNGDRWELRIGEKEYVFKPVILWKAGADSVLFTVDEK